MAQLVRTKNVSLPNNEDPFSEEHKTQNSECLKREVNSQEKRMLFYMGFIGFEKRKSRYPSPMTNEKTPFLKEFYFDLFHFVLFKYPT